MILGDFVWKLSSKQRQISARADEWKGNPLLETQFSPMTTQLYMILRDANSKQRRMTAGSDGWKPIIGNS